MFFRWLLIVSLLASRLVGLKWGNGFFFHPDENNMAWAVGRLSWPNLNPQFFAYGQFPLYLVYFSYQVLAFVSGSHFFQNIPFSWAVYLLRFWSAFFSIATVIVAWLLAKQIFKKEKWANVYVLLLIFASGLIQIAHFGTTESIMTFVGLSLAYFCLKFQENKKNLFLFFLALISAIGLASKLSAALFLFGPLMVLLRSKKKLLNLFIFGTLTFLLIVFFSPYYLLDFSESWRIFKYESGIARGSIPVFYTRQFIKTKPVIFQLTKIFPWTLGLPMFFLLIPSLIFFILNPASQADRSKFLILNSVFLPWLFFNSFLFTKWTRFMTPILPFLVLPVVWFLKEASRKKQKFIYFLLFLLVIPGVVFMKIYFWPDVRFQASHWMNKNLPKNSVILSEAGNVVDLPLFNHQDFKVINFDFYNLDESSTGQQELMELIARADYILLPSRRILADHIRLPNKFSKTAEFYNQLFSGELGFDLVKEFRPFFSGAEFFLGSDLDSEETWTVFDHPTIRLFAKSP